MLKLTETLGNSLDLRILRLHHSRRELDSTSRELLEIHLLFAGALSEPEWILIDRLTFQKASRIGEDSKPDCVVQFYASIKHNTQSPRPLKRRWWI